MRKIFLGSVLIILCIIFFLVLSFGLKIGPIKIMSYDEIRNLSINEKKQFYELNNNASIRYQNKEKILEQKLDNYKLTKEKYDNLLNNGTIKTNAIESYINIYNFNEIWPILQNYAKEKGIVLDLEIEPNNNVPPILSTYKNYNLKFTLIGEYINITDYIYELEDNDKLGFEIRNFEMFNDENGLVSKFNVNSVPISKDSIN